MPGYAEFTKDLSDKVAEAAKPAQDLSVDVLSTVSDAVGKYVPEVPLPQGVPSPREVVDASFDMIEQFLGSQRDYVKRLARRGRAYHGQVRGEAVGQAARRQDRRGVALPLRSIEAAPPGAASLRARSTRECNAPGYRSVK